MTKRSRTSGLSGIWVRESRLGREAAAMSDEARASGSLTTAPDQNMD
jgi:hypothetical protein